MNPVKRAFCASIILVLSNACIAAPLSALHADGARLVDASNKPVTLKGCNLGNWYILESWMFGGAIEEDGKPYKDQAQLFATFRERFGDEKTIKLIDLYRDGYITARDFDQIKSFGFNVVRLPFDFRMLANEGGDRKLKPDAFKRLDHAVDLAEQAGVYIILDMHGTPGGQSKQDHTGQSDQNAFWHNAENQTQFVELWKAVAEHYKNRPSIAFYDLMNEPYADFKSDIRSDLADVMPKAYAAIRSTGDQHVMVFPGALNGGIAFYGNPHDKQMTNVGFTEHYYPGLFGDKSVLESHARTLGQELPGKLAYVQRIGAPYFVGEFNAVLDQVDAPRMMRAYYDRFAENGWPATMWSCKLLSAKGGAGGDAWYMVTNAEPLARLDIHKSSYEAFEAFFKQLPTMKLAANERLREALTTKTPSPLYLRQYPKLPTEAPNTPDVTPAGWTSVELGTAKKGHTLTTKEGGLVVLGGGADIFGTSDAARFVSKPAGDASVDLAATVTSFLDTDRYAKSGLMARWDDDPKAVDAAMAMVNVFPDGTLALVTRGSPGEPAKEIKLEASVKLPVQLRLQVSGGHVSGSYRSDGTDWHAIATTDCPEASPLRVGVVVCSHSDSVLSEVVFNNVGEASTLPTLKQAPGNSKATAIKVANASFEQVGKQPDVAADWNRWGDWMNREGGWSPTHSGKAVIGYHHWQIEHEGSSGLWQDVKVKAGERYAYSIYAQHDDAKGASDAMTIEMRMESIMPDGQPPIALNSQDYQVKSIATGTGWSKITVTGTAMSETLRVLTVISAAKVSPRGGAVKLDDAVVETVSDRK